MADDSLYSTPIPQGAAASQAAAPQQAPQQAAQSTPQAAAQGGGDLYSTPIPQGASVSASAPEQGGGSEGAPQGGSTTGDFLKGAGIGAVSGMAHTLHGIPYVGEKLVPEAGLQAMEGMTPDSTAGKIGHAAGYGGETLTEFILGDEALQGLALSQRLGAAAKIAKTLEGSPKTLAALKIGAEALSSGVVAGTQEGLRTGSVKEGLKAGATMAGTSAVIGGALAPVKAALAAGAKTAETTKALATEGEQAIPKPEMANTVRDWLEQAKESMHNRFQAGIDHMKDAFGDETIEPKEAPMADTAKDILKKPVPSEHPFVSTGKEMVGEGLDPSVRTFIEQIAKGEVPDEAAAQAAKAGEEGPKIVLTDAEPEVGEEAEAAKTKPAPPADINALTQIRQLAREKMSQYDYGDINARALRKLINGTNGVGGIDGTIDALAEKVDNPELSDYYKTLRSNYRNLVGHFESSPVINKLMEARPGRAVDDVEQALISGTNQGAKLNSLKTVLDSVDPTHMRDIADNVMRNWIKDATTESGTIDYNKFLKSWDKAAKVRDELFSRSGSSVPIQSVIDDARTARNVQFASKVGLLTTVGGHFAGPLGVLVGLAIGSGEKSAGKDLINYVVEHPKVWKMVTGASKIAESKPAAVASKATKFGIANTLKGIYQGTSPALAGE